MPPYFAELKVQVIDDQHYMLSVLASILASFGIRHVEAHPDAAAAFNGLAAFDANLILTDWEMKPVDGLQLVRRIRTGKDSPNPYEILFRPRPAPMQYRTAQAGNTKSR